MKTNNNNTQANGMENVIKYAAELLNAGATVTSFEKFGFMFREIRKGNNYVCLCASDFAKAAAIAAGLPVNNSSEEIENVSECTTVRRHATAGRVAEICKTIANAVSVCYGSSFPVTDMATDLDRFGAWCAGEDEYDVMEAAAPFWFAVRKRGSESGTREHVKERCKHLGAPVYVIKVEREEYTALYTVTVRVSSPATGEKVADSNEDQREALSEVCRVSAVLSSVKAQAKETARKAKKAAARVSLVVFRVLWAVSILAATLGVMFLCASFLGDVVPASTPFVCRLLLFVVGVFLPSFAVEFVLLKVSKAIDIATNRRLFAMA